MSVENGLIGKLIEYKYPDHKNLSEYAADTKIGEVVDKSIGNVFGNMTTFYLVKQEDNSIDFVQMSCIEKIVGDCKVIKTPNIPAEESVYPQDWNQRYGNPAGFLHTHPGMETKFLLDDKHVVVDKKDWLEFQNNRELYIKPKQFGINVREELERRLSESLIAVQEIDTPFTKLVKELVPKLAAFTPAIRLAVINKIGTLLDNSEAVIHPSPKEFEQNCVYIVSEIATGLGFANTAEEMKKWNDATHNFFNQTDTDGGSNEQ